MKSSPLPWDHYRIPNSKMNNVTGVFKDAGTVNPSGSYVSLRPVFCLGGTVNSCIMVFGFICEVCHVPSSPCSRDCLSVYLSSFCPSVYLGVLVLNMAEILPTGH